MLGIRKRRPPPFGGVHVDDDKDIQIHKPEDVSHNDLWSEARLLLRDLIFALMIAALVVVFIVQPVKVEGTSMLPRLHDGERIFVNKLIYYDEYSWAPKLERGDIVVFWFPDDPSKSYIKRVIGLPGDTVEVRAGRLVLNGQPVASQVRPPAMIPVDPNAPCGLEFAGSRVMSDDGTAYCRLPIVRETLPGGPSYDTIDLGPSQGDNFGPITVPPAHLFLMGDNRDRSADSRFGLGPPENGLGGPVPWENIGGRAEFITFSLDGTTQLLNPLSWFRALRGGRAGDSLRGPTDSEESGR